jgi:hypothetical protein
MHVDLSKRTFLRAAGLLVADHVLQRKLAGTVTPSSIRLRHKVIVVIFGGVRFAETFSLDGLENIPHLSQDLLPQSLFYTHVRNEGVTAHFNAISSILTGNWQRVDDWGKLAPASPTLFEYLRKQLGVPKSETWVVASNKALTSMIGASADSGFGPEYGANVIFPKQLIIAAVENAIWQGRTRTLADRTRIQNELEAMLEGSNYEGLGWTVFDAAQQLDPRVRVTTQEAITEFVQGGGATSGDELTYFVSREVMRKFAPSLLIVIFSDVEVAHFGSYSLHLAGIKTGDRLAYQLWQEVQANSEYRGRTTMVILPEFGRDPDGTNNGFFNHRLNEESTRTTWMMWLGAAVDQPQVVERPVRHVDLCPTVAALLSCRLGEAEGVGLRELHG